jgi:hypothetical protein
MSERQLTSYNLVAYDIPNNARKALMILDTDTEQEKERKKIERKRLSELESCFRSGLKKYTVVVNQSVRIIPFDKLELVKAFTKEFSKQWNEMKYPFDISYVEFSERETPHLNEVAKESIEKEITELVEELNKSHTIQKLNKRIIQSKKRRLEEVKEKALIFRINVEQQIIDAGKKIDEMCERKMRQDIERAKKKKNPKDRQIKFV